MYITLDLWMQDPILAEYLVLNAQISNSLTLGAQRVAAAVHAQADNSANSVVSNIDQVRQFHTHSLGVLHLPPAFVLRGQVCGI